MYKEILEKAIETSAVEVHASIEADISETGSPLKFLIKEFDGVQNVSAMISQSMLRAFQKLLAEEIYVMQLSNQEVSDAAAQAVSEFVIDFLTGYQSSCSIAKNEIAVEALQEMAKTSVGEEIFAALRSLSENFDEDSLQSFTPGEGPRGAKSSTFFGH